jgi:phosphoglycolate phosphatase-like HAD superfamily hydrolase
MKGPSPALVIFDLSAAVSGYTEGMLTAVVSALRRHGFSVEPELASVAMGYPAFVAVERLLHWLSPDEHLDSDQIDAIFQTYLKEHLRCVRFSPGLSIAPGFTRTCERLQSAGIWTAIGTTAEREILGVLFDRLGWCDGLPVDAWVCSGDIEDVRPGPGMVRALMQTFDVASPEAVVKVGDTPVDIEEGHNAGCGWSMLLDNGWLDALSIESCRPQAILEFVDDLLAYLPIRFHQAVRN